MLRPLRSVRVALAISAVAAACERQPTATGPVVEPVPPVLLSELRCVADATRGTLSCGDATPDGPAAFAVVTVGGQNHFVRLASSNTAFDSATGMLTSTVTVQNLLVAPMGTADGTTPHSAGVQIFIHEQPQSPVTVAAPDTGTFTASNQPYFRYSGEDLGADGILSSGELSQGEQWGFVMNGAASFTFTVYVQAAVPDGSASTVHFDRMGTGQHHTCGVTPQGRAYCWGSDVVGQGGNGAVLTGNRIVPTAVAMPEGVVVTAITASEHHTCAVAVTGAAYCWGRDTFGALGNGVDAFEDQVEPSPVQMPVAVGFTAVATGIYHTCALSSAGAAYCWGWNGLGQLGNGDTARTIQAAPSAVSMPDSVLFSAIATGDQHSCGLTDDGAAYCWGSDVSGQLGNGPADSTDLAVPSAVAMPAGVVFTAITASGGHTCALATSGKAYCWGWDGSGQLGNGGAVTADQTVPGEVQGTPAGGFTRISAGYQHTCALTATEAYCWGADENGQLGNGSTVVASQPAPVGVELPVGIVFTSVAAGNHTTCATSASAAYCWGYNGRGGLGDGTAFRRHTPVVVAATR